MAEAHSAYKWGLCLPPSERLSYECSTLCRLGREILHLLILMMLHEDAHEVSEKMI